MKPARPAPASTQSPAWRVRAAVSIASAVAVERALEAMRAGATLHLQYEPSREWWLLSNGWTVPADVAAIVINHPASPRSATRCSPTPDPRPGASSNRRRTHDEREAET